VNIENRVAESQKQVWVGVWRFEGWRNGKYVSSMSGVWRNRPTTKVASAFR
jgi:hypothetical protein